MAFTGLSAEQTPSAVAAVRPRQRGGESRAWTPAFRLALPLAEGV